METEHLVIWSEITNMEEDSEYQWMNCLPDGDDMDNGHVLDSGYLNPIPALCSW